jgi:hypothetical protein
MGLQRRRRTMIDTKTYQPEESISGDSEEDTQLLREMAKSARKYLQSFKWCPPIGKVLLAYGVGGVVAVFLVEFERPINGTNDKSLWAIVGDVPSAYMVTDKIPGPKAALETYCGLMEDWANAVKNGAPLENAFPVKAEATPESAARLQSRIQYIRKEIIPNIDCDSAH